MYNTPHKQYTDFFPTVGNGEPSFGCILVVGSHHSAYKPPATSLLFLLSLSLNLKQDNFVR